MKQMTVLEMQEELQAIEYCLDLARTPRKSKDGCEYSMAERVAMLDGLCLGTEALLQTRLRNLTTDRTGRIVCKPPKECR
jgi:hypothetical protein